MIKIIDPAIQRKKEIWVYRYAWKVLALEIGVESPIDDFSSPILGLFPETGIKA